MLLPKAFAGNKRIVKLTNISRDKEVWGDNALVNGKVFESVLIPQHGEDDREKLKLPSGWYFYYKVKVPPGRTIYSSYHVELCSVMRRKKIIQTEVWNLGSEDLSSNLGCMALLLTFCVSLHNQQAETRQMRCILLWVHYGCLLSFCTIPVTSSIHYSPWQEPTIFTWDSVTPLLKAFIFLLGFRLQCMGGARSQTWADQYTASSGHKDWFSDGHTWPG